MQQFNPSDIVNGVSPIYANRFTQIATDLATRGINIDGGGYGRVNTAYLTLLTGDLPGTSYSVTGASWSGGTVTLTIGAHNIKVNQRVSVSSVSPTGYSSTSDTFPVTAVTGTAIKYAVGTNPGSYVSGGTVLVSGSVAAVGMLALSPLGQLLLYNGSAFASVASSVAGGIGISLGPAATGNSQSSQSLTLNGTNSSGTNEACSLYCDLNGALRLAPATGSILMAGSSTNMSVTVQNTTAGGGAEYILQTDNQAFQLVLGGSTSGFNYLGIYDQTNSAFRVIVRRNGIVNIVNTPTYASDSAAGSGGLVTNDIWKDSSGNLHSKL